jgi:hypothetical protein
MNTTLGPAGLVLYVFVFVFGSIPRLPPVFQQQHSVLQPKPFSIHGNGERGVV